jgi:PAS domain-containing protein
MRKIKGIVSVRCREHIVATKAWEDPIFLISIIMLEISTFSINNHARSVASYMEDNNNMMDDYLRFLASIVQSSEDAIIGEALDGTITSWNLATEKMFGYNEKEALGKSMTIIGPSDKADEFRQIMDKIQQGLRIER